MPKNKKTKPSKKGVKRNNAGQFVKGHCGGPGNPHLSQERKLRAELFVSVTKEDLDKIITKAKQQAERGDAKARDFLFDRMFGKPTQQVNLADVDGGPLEITVNVTAPNNK